MPSRAVRLAFVEIVAMPHGVQRVLCARVPTKVGTVIVCRITIAMTYLVSVRRFSSERERYESVHGMRRLLQVLPQTDVQVTTATACRRKHASGTRIPVGSIRAYNLNPSIQGAHTPVVRHLIEALVANYRQPLLTGNVCHIDPFTVGHAPGELTLARGSLCSILAG